MFDVALDHVDETSASLSDRARPQVANHIRSLPEQTLDALLRIEEVLTELRADLLNARMEKQLEAMEPQDEPKPAPKGKRK
jgi:hypothetical protein